MTVICLMMPDWDPAPWQARLLAARPDFEVRIWPEAGNAAEIDFALVWKPERGALAGLENLKVIFSLGAGVDHIFTAGDPPDVPIVRIVDPDLTARMSEWVVMHALMILRDTRKYARLQREKVWSTDEDPAAREVRVGVMGTGVLGADAAKKLAVMGFDVACWGRTEKDLGTIPVFHGRDGLTPFLARTDILVSLLPHTAETENILDADLFGKLARDGVLGGPWLVNAGRGALQDEDAMLDALDSGTLEGAVLDVFRTEPLPPESRFWTHPKVTLTPHNSAISDPRALVDYVVRQIDRFERGLPLENVVDAQRGY